jgi:hypothetical protein
VGVREMLISFDVLFSEFGHSEVCCTPSKCKEGTN